MRSWENKNSHPTHSPEGQQAGQAVIGAPGMLCCRSGGHRNLGVHSRAKSWPSAGARTPAHILRGSDSGPQGGRAPCDLGLQAAQNLTFFLRLDSGSARSAHSKYWGLSVTPEVSTQPRLIRCIRDGGRPPGSNEVPALRLPPTFLQREPVSRTPSRRRPRGLAVWRPLSPLLNIHCNSLQAPISNNSRTRLACD